MTAAKSTRGVIATPTAAAVRAASTARAARNSAFDGTHPVFRQSPPRRFRSMMATRAPSPAAPAAHTRPAVPPPITTRS